MNRVLVTLAFVLALAGPSGATTCADVLGSNVYSCHVKSSFGGDFTDCFRFTSPGVVSTHFDLAIDGLGQTLGCDCQTGGSINSPKFSSSKTFECVAQSGDLLGIAFLGKAAGPKIKKGQAVNQGGDTFIYDCVLSPVCPPVESLPGSPNPYRP